MAIMDTTWSIFSGGRLKNQIAENSLFRITTDDALESILLRSATVKQSFEDKLRSQLSTVSVHNSTLSTLCFTFQSAVVVRESAVREVELSLVVTDEENDSLLWYFILTSPEKNISPDNLDEIVSLIINHLPTVKANAAYKFCP
jgi:hypothetical protein